MFISGINKGVREFHRCFPLGCLFCRLDFKTSRDKIVQDKIVRDKIV